MSAKNEETNYFKMSDIVEEVPNLFTKKLEQYNVNFFTYLMHLFSVINTIEVKIIGHMGTHSNILGSNSLRLNSKFALNSRFCS
jgi:hypothetical protein